MTNDQLENVADGLANVSAAFKEFRRQWHPSNGGQPPFEFLDGRLAGEARRLRSSGQEQLADALEAMRADIGEASNG